MRSVAAAAMLARWEVQDQDYRVALLASAVDDDIVALPFTAAQLAIALVVCAVGLAMWGVLAWGVAKLMGLL